MLSSDNFRIAFSFHNLLQSQSKLVSVSGQLIQLNDVLTYML